MSQTSPALPTPESVDAVARLAREAQYPIIEWLRGADLGPGLPETVPVLLAPGKDPKAVAIGALIESYRLEPSRRRGTAEVTTLAAFIDLTNRHKDAHSVVFARTAHPGPKLTAVIDYHQTDGKPRHCGHRIDYAFPLTEEFSAWIAANGQAMGQLEFAQFLEEHAAELSAPSGAEEAEFERMFKERFSTPNELLDLSRSLEIFVGAKVKRQERLQTGERVVEFTTEHSNAAGDRVDIPGIFMVAVQAFVAGTDRPGDRIRIPARLRYRVKGGDIQWFYQLYRWEYWLRVQVQADLAEVAEKTGLPTYEGKPEVGLG